ncbi:Methyltransferase-like protein 21B [Basidiobolus ranarum]|uniref:Methyltransferase-like protein 21B n=1 Tax=Basidiobolus ranarum TaxID=34480 RepID=A0ABR2W613_9FUNG
MTESSLVPWRFCNPYANQKYDPVRSFLFNGHKITIEQKQDQKIDITQNTGNIVWDGAYILSKFVQNHVKVKGKKCIELGAGTGLVGLVTWTLGGKVTLTEIADLVQHTQKNVELNVATLTTKPSTLLKEDIEVKTLTWGNEIQLNDLSAPYDVILGSEILYLHEFHKDLLKTLRLLSGPKTEIYMVYKQRGLGEEKFFLLAKRFSFLVEEIPQDKIDTEFQNQPYRVFKMSKA